jgi:NAD(P)-dependent dehydrogenase (short-subunit alcohol dehydrogenase family)
VALVTGAQQGIGRAIALAFAQEGADVVVNYLDDRAAAEHVAEQARKAGVRAVVAQADVSRVDEGQALVTRAVQELGGLDVLVNNAGGSDTPVLPDAPLEHSLRVFALNLLGARRSRGAAQPASSCRRTSPGRCSSPTRWRRWSWR